MLELGVIEESHSDWASPIVLVPKMDGSVRFCVDYRRVNAVSKFDAYPMPRVDELLDRLGVAHFYSTLDLTKGYWQIPLSPLSKEKTAFTTPFGLHQFITLPFGLFGAPATFQRLMDKVLRPHNTYAAAYLDDIIIHSNDWQRNMEHLHAVLRSLSVAELTVNVSNGSVQLGGWRYGIWASTRGMDRCVPKLIRQLRLRPVQVPRPKRRWDSSWGCRDIIECLFLIIRTSPARWLISLKRKHPTRSSGRSCAFLSKATYTAFKLYIFCQYVCSLGIEPTTFCAANAILYHWATGTFPDSDTW